MAIADVIIGMNKRPDERLGPIVEGGVGTIDGKVAKKVRRHLLSGKQVKHQSYFVPKAAHKEGRGFIPSGEMTTQRIAEQYLAPDVETRPGSEQSQTDAALGGVFDQLGQNNVLWRGKDKPSLGPTDFHSLFQSMQGGDQAGNFTPMGGVTKKFSEKFGRDYYYQKFQTPNGPVDAVWNGRAWTAMRPSGVTSWNDPGEIYAPGPDGQSPTSTGSNYFSSGTFSNAIPQPRSSTYPGFDIPALNFSGLFDQVNQYGNTLPQLFQPTFTPFPSGGIFGGGFGGSLQEPGDGPLSVRWKPSSDNDGNLVVLSNYGAPMELVDASGRVIAQGQNHGASNGYGATVRFPTSGRALGNEAFLRVGGRTYRVPNPGQDAGVGNQINLQPI